MIFIRNPPEILDRLLTFKLILKSDLDNLGELGRKILKLEGNSYADNLTIWTEIIEYLKEVEGD